MGTENITNSKSVDLDPLWAVINKYNLMSSWGMSALPHSGHNETRLEVRL